MTNLGFLHCHPTEFRTVERMTLEAALSLPAGPELDALVAEKVLGLALAACDAEPGETWVLDRSEGAAARPRLLHPYSRDIAAAWEVAGKWPISLERQGEVWSCFVNRDGHGFCPDWSARGDTAPLAIVRAALKACWKD